MPRRSRATMPVTSRQLKSWARTFEKIRCKAARRLPARMDPKALAWTSGAMKKEFQPAARTLRSSEKPLTARTTNRSGCPPRGLMQGRADDVGNAQFGTSVEESFQAFQNFRIAGSVVGFRIFLGVPQTDGDHVGSARHGKCDFVLKPFLPAQDRKHVSFKALGEIAERIRFQADSYIASVHSQPPQIDGCLRGETSDVLT